MGLVPYLFYAIPTAAVGALTWWGQRRAKKIRENDDTKPLVKEIHEQVRNSHTSNMREDMDEIRDLLKSGFARVEHRIDGLQDDLRTERLERIAGDAKSR